MGMISKRQVFDFLYFSHSICVFLLSCIKVYKLMLISISVLYVKLLRLFCEYSSCIFCKHTCFTQCVLLKSLIIVWFWNRLQFLSSALEFVCKYLKSALKLPFPHLSLPSRFASLFLKPCHGIIIYRHLAMLLSICLSVRNSWDICVLYLQTVCVNLFFLSIVRNIH